ncbi:stress protein, tellurium resistance protein TerZ [Campylobacter geochelonis]|uniref:stress protein, tellurium resistance protein TerZ n=1 Tax=Campylobacter geochelonis TaxID=1780362 RepID=UPI0007707E3C|nr:stress protein, tellurium resistance protein TerZ [Campylobacter geochelonis]CZE49901.1 Uncharacterised protein [Campylobacter geochelonis]
MKKVVIFMGFVIFASANPSYEIPPSDTTTAYVEVISDELMQECIKIYNEAKWLEQDLNSEFVNQYSSYEVDKYNQKVRKYSQMIEWFNLNCANKQSKSACKAANKLNGKNGLPLQNCH